MVDFKRALVEYKTQRDEIKELRAKNKDLSDRLNRMERLNEWYKSGLERIEKGCQDKCVDKQYCDCLEEIASISLNPETK